MTRPGRLSGSERHSGGNRAKALALALTARYAKVLDVAAPSVYVSSPLGRMSRCAHCDEDTPRRLDGICDACHTYRYRTGHLPADSVLLKRWARRSLTHG